MKSQHFNCEHMVERVRRESKQEVVKSRGFQKGHQLAVGNNGPQRKKEKRRITAAIINELERETGRRIRQTNLHRFAKTVVSRSIAGDIGFAQLMVNRVEGSVPQSVELTGKDQGPIKQINVNMSLEEAAQVYADTLKAEEEED